MIRMISIAIYLLVVGVMLALGATSLMVRAVWGFTVLFFTFPIQVGALMLGVLVGLAIRSIRRSDVRHTHESWYT